MAGQKHSDHVGLIHCNTLPKDLRFQGHASDTNLINVPCSCSVMAEDQETIESDKGVTDADRPSYNMEKETPMKNYLDNSTLHGLPFVLSSKGFRRFVWIILMLTCSGILVHTIFNVCSKLLAYKSVISVTTEAGNETTGLKFPVITICNRNMLLKSRINGTYSQVFLDAMDPLKKEEMNGTNITNPIEFGDLLYHPHNISDMLVECKWKGKDCGPQNFTPSAFSDLQVRY